MLFQLLEINAAEPGQGDLIELRDGGRVVARYQPEGVPMKPFVKELFTPAGINVTVDSPPDHFHHHGLMFAIGAGDVDFWTEKPFEKFGRQLPRVGETRVAANGLKQTLDWVSPKGASLLVESREVRLQAAPAGRPKVLTWISDFETAGQDPVKLWGRHYFGLGIRFPAGMDAKTKFDVSEGTPPGRLVRGDETVRSAPWCAAKGEISGKPVTIAMWDHPRNPRRAFWFTMSKPFSYLSATLDLEDHPFELKPGVKLSLSYGVAVFDGTANAEQIEEARASWLAAEK